MADGALLLDAYRSARVLAGGDVPATVWEGLAVTPNCRSQR
jgi:hypothetical protein